MFNEVLSAVWLGLTDSALKDVDGRTSTSCSSSKTEITKNISYKLSTYISFFCQYSTTIVTKRYLQNVDKPGSTLVEVLSTS